MKHAHSWSPSLAPAARGSALSPSAATFEREADQLARDVSLGRSAPAPHRHAERPLGPGPAPARAGGKPLDAATRSFFEARMGHDFGRVRVHTDRATASATRDLAAEAFTLGNDIAFGENRYHPESSSGRDLIAHELAHVVQQRSGAPQRAGIGVQLRPTPAPPPTTVPGLQALVDQTVRKEFRLGARDLSSSRTKFVSTAEFAKRIPESQLVQHLQDLFFDHPGFGSILKFNGVPHPTSPNDSWSPTQISMLREFLEKAVAKKELKGQTGEYDVTTGSKFPPQVITPRDLVSQIVAGVTDIAPDLPQRSITIQKDRLNAGVLIHEVCHFYVHDAFRDMAFSRKDANEFVRNAQIKPMLLEGFAQHFASLIAETNVPAFGRPDPNVYPFETKAADELIIRSGGEAAARAAYFRGDKKALAAIEAGIDQLKSTLPLRPPVYLRPPVFK